MALKKSQIRFEEVDGRRFAYRKRDGKQVCGAKAKSAKGEFCSQSKVAANGRCRMHGANSGRPITVGRWDRALGSMADAWREARADPDLLSLERVIAVLDMEITHAFERVEQRDSPEWRRELLKAFRESQSGEDGAPAALTKLGELIENGCDSDDARMKMRQQADRLAQRLEKVWSVKLAQKNAVSATDLVSILGHFLDFVRLEAGEEAAAGVERRMSREMARKPKPSRVGLN